MEMEPNTRKGLLQMEVLFEFSVKVCFHIGHVYFLF